MKTPFRILTLFMLYLPASYLGAQIPNATLDLNEFWQLNVESTSKFIGAKINLKTDVFENFLRLGSLHEVRLNEDPDNNYGPFISKNDGDPLVFLIEDLEANDPQEYMRVTKEEELQIKSLGNINNKTKNVVALADGTLKIQDHLGFGGYYSISPHEFVSFNNPGDDQNFNVDSAIIFHENNLDGFEILVAPVHLPQGAIIKQINVMYRDNAVGDTLDVDLFVRAHLDPFGATSGVLPIGQTLDGPGVQVMSAFTNLVVNNLLNYYYIYVAEANDDTDWPGENVGISSVIIFYDIGL